MIDEKKLTELREQWNTNSQCLRMVPIHFDVDEALETLESLWKVAWAAKLLSSRLHSDKGILPGEIDNVDEAIAALNHSGDVTEMVRDAKEKSHCDHNPDTVCYRCETEKV